MRADWQTQLIELIDEMMKEARSQRNALTRCFERINALEHKVKLQDEIIAVRITALEKPLETRPFLNSTRCVNCGHIAEHHYGDGRCATCGLVCN